jgi:hypothetical protein
VKLFRDRFYVVKTPNGKVSVMVARMFRDYRVSYEQSPQHVNCIKFENGTLADDSCEAILEGCSDPLSVWLFRLSLLKHGCAVTEYADLESMGKSIAGLSEGGVS